MVGVFLGRFATEEPEAYETNMDELFEFFKQGKIKPAVNQSFKMDDFVSAFNIFKERKVMGKVTLEFKK
jgi:NADPH2:quinone reductase